LPNREIFEEIYPESESDDEDDEDEDEEDEREKVSKALEEVNDKITALVDEQRRAKEIVASAASRLKILDAYGNSLDKKRGVDIETSIEQYRKEREKVFGDHMSGTIRDRQLEKELKELREEAQRLERVALKEKIKAAKAKAKIEREKAKIKEKKQRRERERQKEKTRIRKERENFWARYCYSVRITLDAASFTPSSSSRRSSIASASDIVKVVSEKDTADDDSTPYTCDLVLSYVTSCAFWSPSYDLALSTTTNTALLCFDAQLTNMTSETWTNCKVTLSTSQTTFSGLQDSIPILVPWRVKLGGRWTGGIQNELIDSREERSQQSAWQASQIANTAQKPRAQYFGVGESNRFNKENVAAQFLAQQAYPVVQQAQQQQQQQQQRAPGVLGGGLFALAQTYPRPGAAPQAPTPFGAATAFGAPAEQNYNIGTGGSLFGGPANAVRDANLANQSNTGNALIAPQSNSLASMKKSKASVPVRNMKAGGLFGSSSQNENESFISREYADEEEEDGVDGDTILEPTPELSFQESAFEETGLTATYDLPNAKTLKPSSTASKQRVARISFANVYFSHTVVAKYKPVAYLKAKLRNTSKLTLLKGPTGLTLDGTFMGRSTLPRCSAGDSFSLSLGVDPAIRVAYPKPDVKRSTTGVFTKGDNSVYTRTVTLVNTRATAGKPVNITVLDQVPVSEDEKLRIDILHPRGMYNGTAVATGLPGKDTKEDKDWGKASATLKKAGEVCWDVVLNPGKSVRLTLEYDVAFPTGDRVVQV